MDFFLNELSIHSQYQTINAFQDSITEMLVNRQTICQAGFRLFCTRAVVYYPIKPNVNFTQALNSCGANIKRKVFQWLSKDGPYWDENKREHSPDEYYEYNGEVVTDRTLGEVAFRIEQNHASCTVSFQPSNYQLTPLNVIWYLTDGQKEISISNFWQKEVLHNFVGQIESPIMSWQELIDLASLKFHHLTLVDYIIDTLTAEPFSRTIANRILYLLTILNKIAECYDKNGNRTKKGTELIDNFFHGENALFSNESDTNLNRFENQLTFRLPTGDDEICGFHGKIKNRQFRVHFNGPLAYGKPVYIVYIGYKITRS